MTFNFSLNLKESDSQINKKILDALRPQVNQYFKKVFASIKNELSNIVISAIKRAPEYDAISTGTLKYEFGLPDSDARLTSILNFWENLQFNYKDVKIKNGQLFGQFTLSMIKSDFSDVLSNPAAILTTEKGKELNWLEWLLLFGDQTIIKDYTVEFGNNPRSRTGKAVMRGVTSGRWSVPSEYSGVQGNNWITRAIDSAEAEINTLINKAMKA